MKEYSLKEHFELRNTRSLRPRRGLGRFFLHAGEAGFSDASGVVWPVRLAGDCNAQKLQKGSIYSFSIGGLLDVHTPVSKYRDNEIFLQVTDLQLQSGEEGATWELYGIPDPLGLPVELDKVDKPFGTFFFLSETSKRVDVLHQRQLGVECARSFFKASGYLELDPPQLVLSGGVERYLNTFKTQYVDHRAQFWQLELPTSPEFSLKKILAEGVQRIFALTHAFRNQGELSRHHDPEFMMLEWYRIGGTLEDLIFETEKLIVDVAGVLHGVVELPQRPWPVFTVRELFLSILQIDLEKMSDELFFRECATRKCNSIVSTDTWDDVFCKLFMEFIEPFLAQKKACFVAYYPQQMGALAAKSTSAHGVVDRFEAYIEGIEICNGYRELIEYEEYLKRVMQIDNERADLSRDPMFEAVMRSGLYPCVGNALGLDRLIAVLRGERDLQAILPWPFASRFPASTVALE